MKTTFAFAAVAAFVAVSGPAHADNMVFSSWGGTTQDAQKAAWASPFTEKTGITVVQDGPTDYGKLKAMVEAGQVTWDVVDVEGDYAAQAGKNGQLEKLDFSVIDKSKLDPRFVTDYSVGSFYYSFVIGCNADAVSACPKTWADLFDTAKFPGKRTFYKWSAPGVIEAALLADGVAADKLYPLDLDRAFKKLDTIKSDIVWWSGGAQSQQLLASAEAPFGSVWNGRMTALAASGIKTETSWEQNITAADSLVVPKGSPNAEAAMKFIAMATSAEPQAALAKATGYAPINVDSAKLMDPETAKTLPDQQTASQVNADMNYWADNRDAIGEKWYAWQAK
ncbi:ABC transporter substrate-binding protein (plasmid) [Rhizobium leguminosarum]|jgi:putative spermidine/putrescine transport system substrate-binding protein|uniref:ABC transporter substrate-binding protein n=1 Tax=Rhizobium TaxID=379 RepID=UPI00035DD7C6|nr:MULTISPECIES: ABC transporter substrate-binding protein [Rhizobium]MBA8832656.1 putative spermidine/putrescine transport system substrate-binding protein [Rhizobium leguminosarum]MCJ9691289.1 ABC transporter substrate-binding protein [Rhizobium sp. PRIMUS64]MDH6276846.1 putative spermidine/putrescine transport system substrate-binding protein [Rhizobium leguminosarum]MVO92808.1 extracellular solute-binding protein [Rhizobium leguminosarum bv. phaseoli]QIO77078.1 ABC transporter substrate-bi